MIVRAKRTKILLGAVVGHRSVIIKNKCYFKIYYKLTNTIDRIKFEQGQELE